MRLDSTRFRHAIGSKAPIEPFAINRSSFQSESLRLWLPIIQADRVGRVHDLSGYRNHFTTNNFEAANFIVNAFGGRALDLGATGINDNDSITLSANPSIAIGTQPFTFLIWGNFRSYGLGNFTDFGRIFIKNGAFDFRFDAASGPFGTGANTRLFFARVASSGSMTAAGGADAEVPLGENIMIALCHDGTLTATGTSIYVNGREITYTVQTDGSGTPGADSAVDLVIGNFPAGDRELDGLIWDARLYVGRKWSAGEVAAAYDPAGRFALYQEHQVPMAVPAAVATNARTASLQGALRRQASLVAAVDASLRASLTIAAALDAAAQWPATGAAGLESALRAARTAQVVLNAALRASLIETVQLDSALRGARSATAGLDANLSVAGLAQKASALDAAVRRAKQETATLNAALVAAGFGAVSLDAPLAVGRGKAADLDAAMQLVGAFVDSELQAALLGTGGGVAALDAVIGMVIAAAASRTFAVPERAPRRVAASDRRSEVPFGQRRH